MNNLNCHKATNVTQVKLAPSKFAKKFPNWW